MIKISLALIFLLFGCSHTVSSRYEKDKINKDADKTVEIDVNEKKENGSARNLNTVGEFTANKVKANRNKGIGIYIGQLGNRSFVALGVLKWLERNGYKIEKLNIEHEKESIFFSPLSLKKTSFLEWKLYQCCREDFPLKDNDQFSDIIIRYSKIVQSERAPFDYSSCDDFVGENYAIDTLCIESAADMDVIEFERSIEGMKILKIKIGQIKYELNNSLVELIEKGFDITDKSKSKWSK